MKTLLRTTSLPDACRERGGTVEGDGRENEPGSVAPARAVALARFNYLLLRARDWTTR